ncbi:MAG: ATPase domain-containing protein [Euryarchaeota archaeon]|nr:ATPase domain-containing protein [Euryarchaeota archaeon]
MNLIKIGITGLDEMLNGGIPRGRTILLTGSTGTGKSTLGTEFLVKGIENSENGVLVSLEEDLEDLHEDYLNFGWDLKELEEEEKLKVITPPMPLKIGEMDIEIDNLINTIQKAVSDINAQRIVIDSLSVLTAGIKEKEQRKKILKLSTLLRELECTSMVISEVTEAEEENSDYGVSGYVFQGIISLYYKKKGASRVRGIEIRKMRGLEHSTKTKTMELTPEGLKVYSEDFII